MNSYAYLYFRIINARFLPRIRINASRERHKQCACTQTPWRCQRVSISYNLPPFNMFKGVPELPNPLFSYGLCMVFLKSKRKQVGCKFVNKLSIYLDNLYFVGSMQECRKWHSGWNWVVYRFWKYIQKHTIQALHQVPTQTNDNFRAKIRCQKTRQNKGILSIKWLLLQNDQNALTTLLHWADDL